MSKTLLTGGFLALCAGFAAASPLPQDLRALLDVYPLPDEHLGLYIAPLDDGEEAIALNASRPFNPASVIKLVPSLAALESLSPAYQWWTSVYTTGSISNAVLNGNLYIKGGGDPYLTADSLWLLLKNVHAAGITRIAGDLVVDDSIFASVSFDRAAFDGEPHRLYNGSANGLMLNFWAVRFTINATSDKVSIHAFPNSKDIEIINKIARSDSRCTRSTRYIRYGVKQGNNSVALTFEGVLSDRCPPVIISRAVIPEERYVESVLPGLWRDAGESLDGRVRRGAVPDDAEKIYSHPSRSLAEVVQATNKFSNNMMARHLLLTLGTLYKDRDIEVEDGLRAVRDWLSSKGLDVPGLHIVNGSGLSRDTRVTARGMANLLRAGFHSRYAPEFLASIPVAGQDPALDRRRFQGNGPSIVRIKTGLIDHVRAMAGYITTRSGKHYIVVLLVNHDGVHQGLGTRLQNAVIRYVLDL